MLRRAIERSENPRVPVLLGGHNLPPIVEIGLTDLPKSGGAPPGPGDDRLGSFVGLAHYFLDFWCHFCVFDNHICYFRLFERI